jgi:hypothetical protein
VEAEALLARCMELRLIPTADLQQQQPVVAAAQPSDADPHLLDRLTEAFAQAYDATGGAEDDDGDGASGGDAAGFGPFITAANSSPLPPDGHAGPGPGAQPQPLIG